MSFSKNMLVVTLVTSSLWGCSITQEKETENQMALAGSQWHVQEIAGAPAVGKSEITITFSEEGSVYGSSSCNRYSGSWESSGNQLMFSTLASTRMACPEALMRQENRFLKLLGGVRQYQVDNAGRLVLKTDTEEVLEAVPWTDGRE